MGLFKRKQKGSAQSAPEHAVIIRYSLSDEQHGTVEEREAIFALEDRLIARIDSQKLGEHDGNEFGGGEAATALTQDGCSLGSSPKCARFRPGRPTPTCATERSRTRTRASSESTSRRHERADRPLAQR